MIWEIFFQTMKGIYFIEETLKSRAVPTPKLLIKDHKDKDEEGNYPMRLIVLASNFTAAFPKAFGLSWY